VGLSGLNCKIQTAQGINKYLNSPLLCDLVCYIKIKKDLPNFFQLRQRASLSQTVTETNFDPKITKNIILSQEELGTLHSYNSVEQN